MSESGSDPRLCCSMVASNLTEGQSVEVRVNMGHVLGSNWCKGYRFVRYEEPRDQRMPSCLVAHTEGTFAGCEVRYNVSQVRPAG